jgi:cytochrome c oxidase subunit 2
MLSGISLLPEQASTLAAEVDALYLFIVAVTAFFGILVTVVVIFFAVKYRTNDPLAVGARIHGSIPLELAWSIIPFAISIVTVRARSTNSTFRSVDPSKSRSPPRT